MPGLQSQCSSGHSMAHALSIRTVTVPAGQGRRETQVTRGVWREPGAQERPWGSVAGTPRGNAEACPYGAAFAAAGVALHFHPSCRPAHLAFHAAPALPSGGAAPGRPGRATAAAWVTFPQNSHLTGRCTPGSWGVSARSCFPFCVKEGAVLLGGSSPSAPHTSSHT